MKKSTPRPVLFYHDRKLMMQYSRRLFTGYGDFRNGEVEKVLTVAQMDAMDSLEFVARKNRVSMKLQRGDIQWVNNLGVLHARDQYRDDHLHRRELQRLWVRNEELSWGIPRDLVGLWTRIFYTVNPQHQAFYPFEAQISNGSRQTRIQSAISNTNTTHLQGAEWARGLKGTEWNASAKDGPPKLSGVEWSATKPLEGGEWTTAKLDSQNGDAVLRGHEWSIGNLRGAEWSVKRLDGREWSATMLNDKGSVSAAKLDGGEWSAARVTRDEQVAKARAAPLHGDEWAAKLKGSEWSAKKLAGSEWAAKLDGAEWAAKLRGSEWATQKFAGTEWATTKSSRVEEADKKLQGEEWFAKLNGSEWSARKLAGSEWAAKLKGNEWTATSRKGEQIAKRLGGEEWSAKLNGSEWSAGLKGAGRTSGELNGVEWAANLKA